MRALISGTRVCQIEAQDFPVAAPMHWVDCDDTVTTRHTFDGTQFIPPQPSEFHEWTGSAWEIPASKQKAAHNTGIDRQIAALEAARPGYPRGVREFMLGVAQVIKAQGGPDLMASQGMRNVEALENAAKDLRAQRLP